VCLSINSVGPQLSVRNNFQYMGSLFVWGRQVGLCYINALPAELLNKISARTMEKAGKPGFSAI
jgi:hypothetical protein